MKKDANKIPKELLTKAYLELNSSYKVADKFGVSATAVKRILKELGVLRTQKQAASIRNKTVKGFKKGTKFLKDSTRKKLSESTKKRFETQKHPMQGKTHTKEVRKKLSESAKKRTGKRNPNYKDGKYLRRPRDYKIAELTKIRRDVFNRDDYTCAYCKVRGGHLHAHHILPYWVKPDAFLDKKNLITVCTDCHFTKAHKGNWHHFDVELVTDNLLIEYSLDRDRLSDLAVFNENTDAIVGSDAINKTSEMDRNDPSLQITSEE
jgi:5-methylcytosine-specific restriction endonuclease McrA